MTGNLELDDNYIIGIKSSLQENSALTFGGAKSTYFPLLGDKAMQGNLNMANHSIVNLKEPEDHQATYAANVKFVANATVDNNTALETLIDTKIEASETLAIKSIDRENVFKKVMDDDDEFKEDDSDIHKSGVQNKNFHLVNKKTYEFKIDYDSSIGNYSTRLSIDLIYLPLGSYTMVYEMYVDDGITIDEIDARSGTLSVGKINSRIDRQKTRSIIHFTKNIFAEGFDALDIEINLKGKTDPQTTIYVVVYGVKGYVNNVSVHLLDRLYYYDNDSVKYEAPINMNGKDITDVNKKTAEVLRVLTQINMKDKKIVKLGGGTANRDAVNKTQLGAVETQVTSQVFTVDNKVTQNKTDIATINRLDGYYYFTDQLKHGNSNTVKFPAVSNNYPYSADNSEFLMITLDGHYQIIYTDFYREGGQFIIHDDTNGNDLFLISLDDQSGWPPITINTVIPINTDNGFNHVRIKMYIKNKTRDKRLVDLNAIFDGAGYSTFYIKYLHA